ncbi:MAG TPA: DUF3775 domain-containing protein [Arenibaculum sp.]|nr:DUF3775 domain-containing protein [Arenibaculum sp.]
MLNDITFEKVEEVVHLAEKARRTPEERADDPRRGGASGDHAVTRAAQPIDPQPAPDWEHALTRYLEDLPDGAVGEIVALYRFGRGEFDRLDGAVSTVKQASTTPREKVAYLASKPDLPDCLRAGLARR